MKNLDPPTPPPFKDGKMVRFGFCAASSLILEFEYSFFLTDISLGSLRKKIEIFEKKSSFKDMTLLL